MNIESQFNWLCNAILSNDFSAFQKMLHEIESDQATLQAVLSFNAFDGEAQVFTLVQVATVHALQTGQTDMLHALIELGAEESWDTNIPQPALIRQDAYYNSVIEDYMSDDETNDNIVVSNRLPDVETDAVDAVFNRALVDGNPYAAAILRDLRQRGANQLTEILTGIMDDPALSQITPLIFSDTLENGNYTTLLEQTRLLEQFTHDAVPSPETRKREAKL